MFYWANCITPEQIGKESHHQDAVTQHVRHTRGHTQVVFQYIKIAVGMANDVDTRNMGVNLVRQIQAQHHGHELCVGQYLLAGDHACTKDVLLVIDIMQKHIDGRHALNQALLHQGPFACINDAWNQVGGNQAFGATLVAIQ